ncbi:MAG: hypothetical protein WDN28_28725 [Chthoniobacter sp.]
MKYSAIMLFIALWMFRGLLPHGPHGLGFDRPDERRLERHRFPSMPSTSPAAPWCT